MQSRQENHGAWNYEDVLKRIKDAGYAGTFTTHPEEHPTILNTVQLFHPHVPIKEEILGGN